ncbi:MAG TPA: hypothetical protein VHI11_11105 [Jiangellaceae bacterium]|nr:hypothetical protein [Jiangellaceae bacterium]
MPTSRRRRAMWASAVIVLAVGTPLGCGGSNRTAQPTLAPSSPSSAVESASLATSTPTLPVPSSAGPTTRVIEVTIIDGIVRTDADRVEARSGETIRVVVTSDVDDELHIHGVDETAALVADVPTTVEFAVEEPGVFEVETHDTSLLLFQLLVR